MDDTRFVRDHDLVGRRIVLSILFCGSFNVQVGVKDKSMVHLHWDYDMGLMFRLVTDGIMDGLKLRYLNVATAMYLNFTRLIGVSSMKVRRGHGITQKYTWHLMHRHRKANGGSDPWSLT